MWNPLRENSRNGFHTRWVQNIRKKNHFVFFKVIFASFSLYASLSLAILRHPPSGYVTLDLYTKEWFNIVLDRESWRLKGEDFVKQWDVKKSKKKNLKNMFYYPGYELYKMKYSIEFRFIQNNFVFRIYVSLISI